MLPSQFSNFPSALQGLPQPINLSLPFAFTALCPLGTSSAYLGYFGQLLCRLMPICSKHLRATKLSLYEMRKNYVWIRLYHIHTHTHTNRHTHVRVCTLYIDGWHFSGRWSSCERCPVNFMSEAKPLDNTPHKLSRAWVAIAVVAYKSEHLYSFSSFRVPEHTLKEPINH